MKKLYIENLGCAKNQVDAEVIAYKLKELDYELCTEASEADLIIVNTCGFIEDAKAESVNTFFALKNEYPEKKFIVSGCLAERYAKELVNELTEADAVFGNRNLSMIKDVVRKVEGLSENGSDGASLNNGEGFGCKGDKAGDRRDKTGGKAGDTRDKACDKTGTGENGDARISKTFSCTPDYPDPDDESDTRGTLFNFPGSAYLKISEGCNHCCSYCAIPVIRGPLRSRPKKAVLEEARRLVSTGIREINLIAQDLAAYGYDFDGKSHFVDLLTSICAIEGDFKIRMLYIHPDWLTDGILNAVKNEPKVLHYFDIPFQHASEKLLKTMGRTGNLESYSALIDKIRKEIPDAVIRTTLMTGYPGDSADCYREAAEFIRRCKFNWMGCFVYSREEDTKAYDFISEEEYFGLVKKAKRWKKNLEKIQEKITEEALQSFVGGEYDVLIEENIADEDLAIGRIYAQAPEVDGLTVVMGRGMVPGNVYRCRIRKVNGVDLDAVKL